MIEAEHSEALFMLQQGNTPQSASGAKAHGRATSLGSGFGAPSPLAFLPEGFLVTP